MTSERNPVVILGPDDAFRAAEVASFAGAVLHASRREFPDGEQLISVADPETLAGREVLIVQNTAKPQDRRLIALLQLVDVARRNGAATVSCFSPYLCYQRQDRPMSPGQAVSGALVLSMLHAATVDTVITVEAHSERLTKDPRFVNLSPIEEYLRELRRRDAAVDLVIAPDAGGALRSRQMAERLGVPTVVLAKRKDADGTTTYGAMPAEIAGARCLIVEDLASSGSTLRPLLDAIGGRARSVSICIAHLLAPAEVISGRLPEIDHLIYTDSCGDRDAPIRLLPLALAAWQRGTIIRVGMERVS